MGNGNRHARQVSGHYYLTWANHDAVNIWDTRLHNIEDGNIIWTGKVSREEFEKVCKRNIEKYFKLPQYYKIDGNASCVDRGKSKDPERAS